MSQPTANPVAWPSEIPALVAAALDNPNVGLIIFESNLCILHGTGTLGSLLGQKSAHLPQGKELLSFLHIATEIDEASHTLLESYFKKTVNSAGSDNFPIVVTRGNGSRLISVANRRIGNGCWVASFEDITMQRETESDLRRLALQDPLTGLANRTSFEQSLISALSRTSGSIAAVFLLDLDRFKAVNDTLGHPTGDGLLRIVSQRLQSVMRESDVIARLGGDEFAMLIVQDPVAGELATLAAHIIDLLQRTYLIGGHAINIGTSIGIAIAPQDGATAERLLKSADLALYQAKGSGRSRFNFFDPAMEERAQARRNLELELRKALPLRQLELHYKPQVDITTQTLLGFETMIRWRHPVRGLMDWAEFAQLSDELDLTLQIGDWMLRTACRDAAQWPAPVGISVSTYPSQFEKGDLVKAVERALVASLLAGNRLEVAITEGILLRNEEGVLTTLHGLRALGVKVAMNDFGTGFASLRQLASFPFDRVNINQSVLADRLGNDRHQAIVRAIASLGASLGIYVMAEGVETSSELARIQSQGCDSLHGYLPGEGLAASELPALIASFAPGYPTQLLPSKKIHEQHCL